ncbi:MAG: hypothetical protein HY862_06910 [Chloroflexi bacterium]|nr:hypothetical protein [Chloroflexota bacterium]
MKKLLGGFIIVVGLCGGLYLFTAGSIHYLQLSAQWPEQRGLEASKLCHADETLKIIRTDNGGDSREEYACEDAQGHRRDVTDEADSKAPGLGNLWRVFVGAGLALVAGVLGFWLWWNSLGEGELP